MSEMSSFGNQNVSLIALLVPIIALKSHCWASMPNLHTEVYPTDYSPHLQKRPH